MFIEANNTELGHSFRSAMFRAPGEQKMLALVGSDPTNVDVARHKDWRFEVNGHSTPKGVQTFKLVKAINIPLLRSDLIHG